MLIRQFINRLGQHTLVGVSIPEEGGNYILSLPVTVKWAIMLDYLNAYEDLRTNTVEEILGCEKAKQWSPTWFLDKTYISTVERFKDNKYYQLDKKRYKWFYAGVKYIARTREKDPYSLSYLIDFVGNHVKSTKFTTEILKTLSEPLLELTNSLHNLSSSDNKEFFQKVDKIELAVLEKMMKDAAKVNIPSTSEALLALSSLYNSVDFEKSEKILEMDSVQSSASYRFYRGHYFYSKFLHAEAIEKQYYYLEKSNQEYDLFLNLKKYDQYLRQSVNKASAYNNLGINYQNLAQIASTEEEKREFLIQSENYFSKAITEAPLAPIYEVNFGDFFRTAERQKEAKRREDIAEILSSKKFLALSKDYQEFVAKFLRAEKSFHYSEPFKQAIMQDGGVFFGELINKNDQIQTLTLHWCLNDEAIAQIASCLHTNTTLTSLQLDYHRAVTDKGIGLLGEAIKENASLQELSFTLNGNITAQAVEKLICKLRPGFTLKLTSGGMTFSSPISKAEKQHIQNLASQHQVSIHLEPTPRFQINL